MTEKESRAGLLIGSGRPKSSRFADDLVLEDKAPGQVSCYVCSSLHVKPVLRFELESQCLGLTVALRSQISAACNRKRRGEFSALLNVSSKACASKNRRSSQTVVCWQFHTWMSFDPLPRFAANKPLGFRQEHHSEHARARRQRRHADQEPGSISPIVGAGPTWTLRSASPPSSSVGKPFSNPKYSTPVGQAVLRRHVELPDDVRPSHARCERSAKTQTFPNHIRQRHAKDNHAVCVYWAGDRPSRPETRSTTGLCDLEGARRTASLADDNRHTRPPSG